MIKFKSSQAFRISHAKVGGWRQSETIADKILLHIDRNHPLNPMHNTELLPNMFLK